MGLLIDHAGFNERRTRSGIDALMHPALHRDTVSMASLAPGTFRVVRVLCIYAIKA